MAHAIPFPSKLIPISTWMPMLCLIGASASALAQAPTPAARTMPDGSKDMYLGLGVSSGPRFRGADDRETDPVLLLQMQWSNGLFVSGASAGLHLSSRPDLEFGPLLAIEPGRDASGGQRLSGIGGVDLLPSIGAVLPPVERTAPRFTEVRARPQAGGFFNVYLNQNLRLTSSLLYGAGNDRDGLVFSAGVQRSFIGIAPHHTLAVSAGANWANRDYHQAYFGVTPSAGNSLSYRPSSGIRDVQLTFNWNWELSNLWLLSSQLTASRLMGDAASSPLVDRRNGVAVRTGLAYRF